MVHGMIPPTMRHKLCDQGSRASRFSSQVSSPSLTTYPHLLLKFCDLYSGTAVYVYCALAKHIESTTVDTQLNFYIDGENLTSHAFHWSPSKNTKNYTYNVSVFANDSLTSGSHNLTVKSWAAFLFDRLVYTCVNAA